MLDVNKLLFNHASSSDVPNSIDITSVTDAIDSYARINNQSAFVIDFDNHELLYCTDSLIFIDEATIKDKKRECVNPYWTTISDEILRNLLDIRNNYIKVGESISIEEYSKHVCTIDYPIILRNKEFYITQKFTPLLMRNDGITKIGLFTINHSTKKEMESTIITPSNKRFIFDFSKSKFIEYDLGLALTLTEKAILHRARKGMTNEEIAESLFVSVNTIKTHRMKIFKKLKVDSITEALALVANYQLL